MNVNFIITDADYDRLSKDDPEILSLAEDIKTNGLMQPIGINKEFQIIWGRRRLFAIKEVLGMRDVATVKVDVSGDEKEIKTLAENLFRKELDFWERGESVRRYHELMARKHPELYDKDGKPVKGRTKKDNALGVVPSMAEQAGISASTLYRDLQIANNIVPEAKDSLKRHKIPMEAALGISRLPKEAQKKVAERLDKREDVRHIKRMLAEFDIDPGKAKDRIAAKLLRPETTAEPEKKPHTPAYEYNIFGHSKFGQEVSHMRRAREAGVNVLPVQLVYIEKARKAVLVYYHGQDNPPGPTLLNVLDKASAAIEEGLFLGIHTVTMEIDDKGEHFILDDARVKREKMESFVSGTAQKETYKR